MATHAIPPEQEDISDPVWSDADRRVVKMIIGNGWLGVVEHRKRPHCACEEGEDGHPCRRCFREHVGEVSALVTAILRPGWA